MSNLSTKAKHKELVLGILINSVFVNTKLERQVCYQ